MSELKPCPFCDGGETRIDERRLSPTMQGPGAVISATVKHWCPTPTGQPTGLHVSMHGRDKDAAIAAWNRRPALTEWRFDMENAPRDGTIIVLGRPETENDIALSVPGHWQDAFDDGVDYMGSDGGFVDIGLTWFRPGRSFGAESHRYLAVQPTAWLPLPSPPVKKP